MSNSLLAETSEIDLSQADRIEFPNLTQDKALEEGVKIAKKMGYDLARVTFKAALTGTSAVCIAAMEKFELRKEHPQFVRTLNGSDYCVVKRLL